MTRTVQAIVGPTAAGKSRLALERARAADGPVEIVAVDAFTIYRGMDIGTAKPAAEDRAAVPHHMIDVLSPDHDVTVSWFQERAREAVDAIRRRGATALLVGGSGLYFRAVVDPLQFPPTDAAVRGRLEDEWSGRPESAWQALRAADPQAAAKIDPGNVRRTVRALEVIELTGELFSSFADAWEDYDSIYPGLEITYVDHDDAALRSRIERRCHLMVEAGLVDEAAALRAGGPLSRTARQAIGYAEAFAVLDGTMPPDRLPEAIATRTWRYAKRQRAWFRKDPRCAPTAG